MSNRPDNAFAHVRRERATGPRRRSRRQRSPSHRPGVSIILVVIVMGVLIAFASLAIDVGRVRLAKVQLQTAADAAATAAVSGMQMFPDRGVLEPQERAVEAASLNHVIDQAKTGGMRHDEGVQIFPEEDMVFGRWLDESREFIRIEEGGGVLDSRRQADAVRVWTRRVSRFIDPDGNEIDRNNALPLIFAPVLGVERGEVWARATAVMNGNVDTAAFVGLQYIRFQGAVRSDSYDAARQSYPGFAVASRNSSFATNGEVTFSGAAQIKGSVHPGINQWIMPQPLRSNIDITGYMFPLSKVLKATTPTFTPPAGVGQFNEPGTIQPPESVQQIDNSFAPNGDVTLSSLARSGGASTHFVFSSWTSRGSDTITIDNGLSTVEIWINGNFSHSGRATIALASTAHPVIFHINGDADVLGNGFVFQPTNWPANLQIQMSRPGTRLRIGGSNPALSAHLFAPVSDVVFSGAGRGGYDFFGRAVGKSLTVAGNVNLHYDESLGTITPQWAIRLVE